MLYWGAEWCPYCKDLKKNVFSRRDLVEKSRLFVPVYLDGDDAGARKWGEEFNI
jgi:protein disulfide-isomerase